MTDHEVDLARSGWDNPEGFVRAPRPNVPAPAVKAACEAPGPDGWVCDLLAGHGGQEHKADDGSPHGLRWTTETHDASTYGTDPATPELVAGRTRVISPELTEVALLADAALKSSSPAAWVRALDKILAVARG